MDVKETSHIHYDRRALSDDELISIYSALLYPRLIEEKMLIFLRQGHITKWFAGIGQEAISVGSTLAMRENELMFTMHRNLGVFTTREVSLRRLFSQWQGKSGGFTKGRDRSFHFGSMEHGIVGMISHLGAQLSLADGVALAYRIRGENKVSLAFTGEGATSEGEFHEALNVAAVWSLPVIFVVENNGYGLSTPANEQYRCDRISDKGPGYGIKSFTIDGNNVLEVYHTIRECATSARSNPQPFLIECETFRMRGHEEASGTKYVPQHLFSEWEKRDPVVNFEGYLLGQGILTQSEIDDMRKKTKAEIHKELKSVIDEAPVETDAQGELGDVYAPFDNSVVSSSDSKLNNIRFVDAISDGLDEAMRRHANLVLMGQDIAEYGGVFKITEGFLNRYGKERVRNTPLCESAILGSALGLSLAGMKAMVEMQFADFVTCGFNQIVNNLAKLHYRWNQNADVVIRMPTGGGMGAGPFHSQSNEAWFTKVPGLKVVYPSNPHDAKGLLLQSFEDPNPVLFFEHKGLYRKISGEVPDGYYTVPIGRGKYVRRGSDVSIITYGLGVHWAQKVVDGMNISADIVDLRTLLPLDYDIIRDTVMGTNRVLLLHEDTLFGGLAGEISAFIAEHLFEFLDAPVIRCASLDTPVPFAKEIEEIYMADFRLKEKLEELLRY